MHYHVYVERIRTDFIRTDLSGRGLLTVVL